MISLDDIFWASITEPNTGCWLWGGRLNADGYAYLYGEITLVHRYTYVLAQGPIPPKLVLDHLCETRCCVNPWHLEVVTRRENTIRGLTGLPWRLWKQRGPDGKLTSPSKRYETAHLLDMIGPTLPPSLQWMPKRLARWDERQRLAA